MGGVQLSDTTEQTYCHPAEANVIRLETELSRYVFIQMPEQYKQLSIYKRQYFVYMRDT